MSRSVEETVSFRGRSVSRLMFRKWARIFLGFFENVYERGGVRGRADGVWYFEVTKAIDLVERVIPFFDRFPLRGPKRRDLR